MNTSEPNARMGLQQFLRTDLLLGVTDVPVVAPQRETHAMTRTKHAATKNREDDAAAVKQLNVLDETQVKGCTKCRLHEGRTNTVFGVGSATARLVFVGEGPGFEEDRQGIPFVGRAGQLLTRMIEAMGLTRDSVYICNVVKCRPPNNRDPASDEIAACHPYLAEQLTIIAPEVIVALGAPAAKKLLETTQSIGKLRGRFHDYILHQPDGQSRIIPLMPTYHPAYLLRSPGEKVKAWEDLQKVMAQLDLPMPKRT